MNRNPQIKNIIQEYLIKRTKTKRTFITAMNLQILENKIGIHNSGITAKMFLDLIEKN